MQQAADKLYSEPTTWQSTTPLPTSIYFVTPSLPRTNHHQSAHADNQQDSTHAHTSTSMQL